MKPSNYWIKRPLALLAFLSAGALSQAQSAAYQVRATDLYPGDGRHLKNGIVVVRDGKIVQVGLGDNPDPKLPLIEHAGALTPGLVACQSMSGTEGQADDRTRSVLAEARVADAVLGGHSDFKRALAAGITTLVIAPSAENLIGGITTVVKTVNATPLKREGHLAISFSKEALGRSAPSRRFFFGKQEDGAPEETTDARNGDRLPTSYAGARRMLSELMANTSEGKSVFARIASGELPVLLEAWDRNEVMRAASFAKEFKLKGALRGAPLGGDPLVTKAILSSGLGVVLGPFGLGHRQSSLKSAVAMVEAEIPMAFALDAPARDPQSFRLTAAMVASAGADREAMLRSLTSVGAKLAGVDGQVGTLKPGMDADFVLWSGHPVNLASSVQAVYVDGKLAFRATKLENKKDASTR